MTKGMLPALPMITTSSNMPRLGLMGVSLEAFRLQGHPPSGLEARSFFGLQHWLQGHACTAKSIGPSGLP
jgi:hypothetical protein